MLKICISIGTNSIDELDFLIKKSLALSDFIELRFDFFDSSRIVEALKIVNPFKSRSIFTLRSYDQQGKFQGTESERIQFLKLLSDSNPMLLDIELPTIRKDNSLRQHLKKNQNNLLISWHNFSYTPPNEELEAVINEMKSFSNNIKLVTMATNGKDSIRLLDLYDKFHNINLIVFAMGDFGILSRILCTVCGRSPFTYATLEQPIASGQLSVKEMRRIYERITQHFIDDVRG